MYFKIIILLYISPIKSEKKYFEYQVKNEIIGVIVENLFINLAVICMRYSCFNLLFCFLNIVETMKYTLHMAKCITKYVNM